MISMERLFLVFCLICTSCANYAERLEPTHASYYSGQLNLAEASLRDLIEDADRDDQPLLKLELASVLQARGNYAGAAALLIASDSWFEVLDYTNSSVDDIAGFAFSVEGVYRVSPPERVMINTQNMINHLAMKDTEGAAVEARRLSALLDRDDIADDELFANSLAWGLAGLAMEANGRVGEAGDFYNQLGAGHPLAPPAAGTEPGMGTIVVVGQLGRAPRRREASFLVRIDGCSQQLNLPVLQERIGGPTGARVSVDGVDRGPVPEVFDLGHHLLQRYDDEFPRLLAAAMAQAVTRSAISEIAGNALAKSVTDDEDDSEALEGFLGCLIQLIFANSLTADVRCWSLLPGRYHAKRLSVAAGSHIVKFVPTGGGVAQSFPVSVGAGEIVLVNLVSGPGEGYRYQPPPRVRRLYSGPELRLARDLVVFRL